MTNDPTKTMTLSLIASVLTCACIALVMMPGDAEAATQIFAASYNPQAKQTDDSPCVGGSGRDLCKAAREGDRTIALSRDLLWYRGGPYRWHDKVRLTSEIPQCNGVYSVEDTMHRRWTARADLFFLSRDKNTSCHATIERVTY